MSELDELTRSESEENISQCSEKQRYVQRRATLPEFYNIPYDVVASVKASIAEFKERCARNGLCPNDGKPCKHYRNCVLTKSEACLNHTPKRKCSHSNVACNNCIHFKGKDTDCGNFYCMTSFRGR